MAAASTKARAARQTLLANLDAEMKAANNGAPLADGFPGDATQLGRLMAREVSAKPADGPTQAAIDRANRDRISEISQLDSGLAARNKAAAGTKTARANLQFRFAEQWKTVISTNWPTFEKLRQSAALSPRGETPCTICDGAGYMHSCVLCKDNIGRCLTCRGTGRAMNS